MILSSGQEIRKMHIIIHILGVGVPVGNDVSAKYQREMFMIVCMYKKVFGVSHELFS